MKKSKSLKILLAPFLTLAIACAFVICFSGAALANTLPAMNQADDFALGITNADDYDVQVFRFKDLAQIKGEAAALYSKTGDEAAARLDNIQLNHIQLSNRKNVNEIKEYIDGLDFSIDGEETREILLKQLDDLLVEMAAEGKYLEEYSILMPKASLESHYGIYNGYDFRQILTTTRTTFDKKLEDTTAKFNRWIGGSLTAALGIANGYVGFAFSAISTFFGNGWVAHDGEIIQVFVTDNNTLRVITVQDKGNYVSGDYAPALQQQKKVIATKWIYHYFPTSTSTGTSTKVWYAPDKTFTTDDYGNSSANMKRALNIYLAWGGSYMDDDALPSAVSLAFK